MNIFCLPYPTEKSGAGSGLSTALSIAKPTICRWFKPSIATAWLEGAFFRPHQRCLAVSDRAPPQHPTGTGVQQVLCDLLTRTGPRAERAAVRMWAAIRRTPWLLCLRCVSHFRPSSCTSDGYIVPVRRITRRSAFLFHRPRSTISGQTRTCHQHRASAISLVEVIESCHEAASVRHAVIHKAPAWRRIITATSF
jgi:hypothetical protein